MNKLRRMKLFMSGIILCACMLCGCSTSSTMSLTFVVETGDNIKVTLDTSGGLRLSQADNGYAVTEGEDTVLQGFFVEQAVYEQYMDAVMTQEGVTVRRQESENGITFLAYSFDGAAGMENNFIIWIDGTATGMVAASLADSDTADRAFQSLSFSKE